MTVVKQLTQPQLIVVHGMLLPDSGRCYVCGGYCILCCFQYEYQPISGKICDIAWDGENKRIAVCGQGREKYVFKPKLF